MEAAKPGGVMRIGSVVVYAAIAWAGLSLLILAAQWTALGAFQQSAQAVGLVAAALVASWGFFMAFVSLGPRPARDRRP